MAETLLGEPGDAPFAQASLDIGSALALLDARGKPSHTAAALSVRIDIDNDQELSNVGIYLVAQSLAHMHAGNLQEAAAIASGGYEVSVERKNDDGQAWFASILALVRLAQGRPATSANLFREAATLFDQLGPAGKRWGLGGLALAGAQLGDLAASSAAVRELDEAPPGAIRMQEIGIARGSAWTSLLHG